MAKVAITKTMLNDLANAITDKTGASNPMTIAEMIDAVEGITSRDSTDLTASGGTVTVPAGMYAAQATKSAVSGTKSITVNGTGIDVAEYASVDVSVPSSQPSLQSKSVTKSTSGTETYIPDSGYDGLSSVAVTVPAADIFSTVLGEFYTDGRRYWRERPVTSNSRAGILAAGDSYGGYVLYDAVPAGTTVTPSTSAQTIGGAKYMMEGAVTVAAMPSGTAGTPTATKGSVSNHSISVTPSVTNTAGYIAGGTLTGTAVSVSASELVSGTLPITSSGTHDVANYASASVASGGATASATKSAVSNHSVTVTPSVTRTAGYVTAGSANGTAVTVTASELASGNLALTDNTASTSCVGYATVSVAVPFVTYYTSSSNPTSSQGSNGDIWLVTS